MGAIQLTGIGAGYAVPGMFVEVNFAQGDAAGSNGVYPIIVLANKLAAGDGVVDSVIYGPDTLVQIQSEADMIARAGAGSEAHRLFRRLVAINNTTAIYWVFVTESAGAKATGTVTITNNATAPGTHRLWVGDEFVDTGYVTGDTPTIIAAAIVANVNSRTHWAVTAANVAGVVTLTAKQNGLRGNWLRYQAALLNSGTTTTTSATTDAFFTGGTTADSNTAALSTISAKRYYYIVSAAEDTTQIGALMAQINTKALPISGLRQRGFAGSVDTLANGITVSTAINNARAEVVWSEKNPWTPAELAANAVAVYSLLETYPKPRTNFANFGNTATSAPLWRVPKSRVDSAAPSNTAINSALNAGLSPIAVNTTGASTYLVNRITTRFLAGSTVDYRIRDAHKVTICDFFADDLQVKLALQNEGCTIANDPPKGAPPPGNEVRYPQIVKGQVYGLIDTYAGNGLLQDPETIKAKTVVQRETSPTTRMGIRVPLATIDNFYQGVAAIDQVA